MANATEDTNQEVKLVKTYCKPADVNVEDLEFIRQQVHLEKGQKEDSKHY